MRLAALMILLLSSLLVCAQRPQSRPDSLRIKALFFAGLREKMNENYEKANDTFLEIVALDSSYAAVYYEIALVNYRQNKLVASEVAIKKAVALDAVNLWYQKLLAEINRRKVPWGTPRSFP